MQESFIFSDTIAHNIALDTDRLEMDRVHRAAIMLMPMALCARCQWDIIQELVWREVA